MRRTPRTRGVARLTLASLAISVPTVAAVATGAPPAMAANAPTVTFRTDSEGTVLATVNRGERAIAGIDCSLLGVGALRECPADSQLSTKQSTTYAVNLSCLIFSACASLISPTLVVHVTLTDGGTASGSLALSTNVSAVQPTAAIDSVFPGGANM